MMLECIVRRSWRNKLMSRLTTTFQQSTSDCSRTMNSVRTVVQRCSSRTVRVKTQEGSLIAGVRFRTEIPVETGEGSGRKERGRKGRGSCSLSSSEEIWKDASWYGIAPFVSALLDSSVTGLLQNTGRAPHIFYLLTEYGVDIFSM